MKCKNCGKDLPPFALSCKECSEGLCDICHVTLKGICEECKDEKNNIPEVWRRSWLTLFEVCPYACYKTAIEGVDSEGNIWSHVGNVLHDVFELASLYKIDREFSVLYTEFTVRFMKYLETEEGTKHKEAAQQLVKGNIITKMYDRATASIETYLEYEKTAPDPIETEIKLFLDIDGCQKISGTIDRINPLEDNEVELVDYKSGKCYYGKKLKDDLQVPIYIMAYRQKYGKLPKRFTFIFTEDGKKRTFERVDDDKYICTVVKREYVISLQETARKIKRIFARVYQGNWSIPSKINSYYCANFCDVAKAGHCAGAEDQEWINLRGNLKR